MKKYKLTIEQGGILLMGAALLAYMAAKGFSVPTKIELVLEVQKLPRAVRPINATPADWKAYRATYEAFKLERLQVEAINAPRRLAYYKQFSDLAAYLKTIFVIATGIYTEIVENEGTAEETRTKEWVYEVEPEGECAYTFQQCADKLLGKYTKGTQLANPIEFIANQNF